VNTPDIASMMERDEEIKISLRDDIGIFLCTREGTVGRLRFQPLRKKNIQLSSLRDIYIEIVAEINTLEGVHVRWEECSLIIIVLVS
jgi:hypothetical protein